MSNKKHRVMVVDDAETLRAAAKVALGKEFEVLCCEDGLDAIAQMAAFRPDLVLVDIIMPRLDGYETVALMRQNDAFRETPILMMSSKGGVFDLARGRLLGFTGNITKPFKPGDLVAAVREHLDGVAAAA